MDLLTALEISEGLTTHTFGKKIYYNRQVDSTNSWAREMATAGAPEGTLVIAERQSAGRGRLGRQWCSPQGGIWLSIILRPQIPICQVQLMTLLTAVVVQETIRKVADLTAGIKWPNDLLYNGRKLAGILTEMSAEKDCLRFLIVGVGLNANVDTNSLPAEIQQQATSLWLETGKLVSRKTWIQDFLLLLEQEYYKILEEGFTDILQRWRRYTHTLGREVTIHCNKGTIRGKAVDINEQGALLVETPAGLTVCWAGDVVNK
ncbi:MAG: biotin--[acetyl-CoA-carboxylase] ligase [Firmicutes bacterium]|jgi:BirA family biotin operon repressor/biotin-[acetyl-CoA-carboxylase] ligase|nr:biotin--[acetyl-CoA-carboxylase] ligase [Bacillota bacterium]